MRVFFAVAVFALPQAALALTATLPDGRMVAPEGFTIPVESFVSAEALSPDGRFLAVLSQDAGAVDVLDISDKPALAERLRTPGATSLAWTGDGIFVTRGYSGIIARFAYDAHGSKRVPALHRRDDLHVDASGLLNGISEDAASHTIAVARTAAHEVLTLDDVTGRILSRRHTRYEPFATGLSGNAVIATYYNADRVAIWRGAAAQPVEIVTGPHPTQLLIDGTRAFVANADGHDTVLLDVAKATLLRRFELGVGVDPPPGQTPSGMALSSDRATLYVAESGYNDVAVVDVVTGRVRGRIPTGWYPTAVIARSAATSDKDLHPKEQLYVASAKGFGSQPNPGGEWNGTYAGFVQHLVVEPARLDGWSALVAQYDRFPMSAGNAAQPTRRLPPIKHVVFIVRENKHFDEEFGDESAANVDPALLLYGRSYTPNAHGLAERYALLDNFMSNGEASDWGHAWTMQGMTNDYHERNRHTRDDDAAPTDARVPWSIWPFPLAGEDSIPQSAMNFDWYHDLGDLPHGPRINVSGVFGPRGELVDELQRNHISYRVYGEQLTMLPDGRIAPGLAAHADHLYPGAHIDFDVLDTARAKLFIDDIAVNGLPQYAYMTLPTDHTAGTKPGFYSPASYVANNDLALGQIVAALSKRPDWRDTVVFVTCDDAQGTGDHVDSHRMPAFAAGPYVRRGVVDHTRYSIPSILRTVELLYGLTSLNIYDAAATPLYEAFADQPLDDPYAALAQSVPMIRNPGRPVALSQELDGADDREIVQQEWDSIHAESHAAVTAAK